MSNQRKWKCCSCDGISIEADLLSATNPFDETMTITGCPICKDVVGFTEICDEPDCVRDASCGFPTPEGYRRTCGNHMRAAEQKMHPTPESLASSQAVVNADNLSQSDSESNPAQARVI